MRDTRQRALASESDGGRLGIRGFNPKLKKAAERLKDLRRFDQLLKDNLTGDSLRRLNHRGQVQVLLRRLDCGGETQWRRPLHCCSAAIP